MTLKKEPVFKTETIQIICDNFTGTFGNDVEMVCVHKNYFTFRVDLDNDGTSIFTFQLATFSIG